MRFTKRNGECDRTIGNQDAGAGGWAIDNAAGIRIPESKISITDKCRLLVVFKGCRKSHRKRARR